MLNRKKTIVIGAVVVALFLVVLGYFLYQTYTGVNNTSQDKGETVKKSSNQDKLIEKQKKLDALITKGDSASISEAEAIASSDLKAAKDSQDQTRIVSASIDSANILIQTGRAQQALDDILFPLNKSYTAIDDYKYSIYGSISWAYRVLGNQDKSNEYLNDIPSKGWD